MIDETNKIVNILTELKKYIESKDLTNKTDATERELAYLDKWISLFSNPTIDGVNEAWRDIQNISRIFEGQKINNRDIAREIFNEALELVQIPRKKQNS